VSKQVVKCLASFGFCSDPEQSKCKNFNSALSNVTQTLHKQPTNLTFHNLCNKQQLPTGTRHLLGLNLRFCLTPNSLNENIKKAMLKMAYSIQTHYHLKNTSASTEANYIPQIYLRNKNWNPLPVPIQIEDQLTVFEKSLKKERDSLIKKYGRINLSNLTSIQASALKKLRNNNQLVIKPTDKNLGPAVMDKDTYVTQVFKEHLHTSDYHILTQPEALSKLQQLKDYLKNLIADNQGSLSPAELTYFNRGLKNQHRIPLFYRLPKVHKTQCLSAPWSAQQTAC
jgi:hypothetical protein